MKLYWGTVFAEVDFVRDVWCHAKVRPRWYWTLRRLQLFLSVVWRRMDSQFPQRMDWRTAWDVAEVAMGLEPHEIHRGGPPIAEHLRIKERPNA